MVTDKNRSLRVCFVCPKAYPLFQPQCQGVIGGAEVDLYLLATELAKDDKFDVSCITADYGQPANESIENVTLIKSLNFKQNQITSAIKIWKAMKKANADIYMLKTASPGVPLAAAFCKLNNKKFVYRTAHQHECDGTYIKDHFILGRAFARSLRSAKMVFAQNEIDKENLQKNMGLDSVVIPNGHRISDKAERKKDIVLWTGRNADFKKPHRFFDLASRFPDEKFVMICQQATGDNSYDDLVRSARQISNLEFIKRVSFTEIDEYFQRAKVFVNTSDSEGFPNTFIQAAKAATAILSFKVNPDNFLEKHNCGIHAKGDMDQLADSLTSLLEGDRFLELGQNARKYVRDCHDIEKIIDQYKHFFKELCSCR